MLCIGRKDREVIEVECNGELLKIVVLSFDRRNKSVRLGFDGPKSFKVRYVDEKFGREREGKKGKKSQEVVRGFTEGIRSTSPCVEEQNACADGSRNSLPESEAQLK